jgi:hypothetical protein
MSMSNRQALLQSLTTLAEDTYSHDLLSEPVTIRELTARQLADAREAARQGSASDAVLWNAVIVQMGVIDSETKAQVFSRDDIPALCDGRNLLVLDLAQAILNLSSATPQHLEEAIREQTFRQRDAGEGAGDAEAGT